MKKGFTLVELMAILIILSVLLILGTSSISKIMKENKQNLYNEQIGSFIESAKTWSYANIDKLPAEGESVGITLSGLAQQNLVKKGVINPFTKEPFPDTEYVCIKNVNDNYVYEYNEGCTRCYLAILTELHIGDC